MGKRTERDLDADTLRELVDYNPETGIFRWKKRRRGVVAGSECGRVTVFGYREIGVNYVLRPAHRLVFLYMNGRWPDGDIDHINCDRLDNRWGNLREATRQQNSYNLRPGLRLKDNPYRGVTWDKARNKWRAQARVAGRKVNLGRFDTAEEAARAADAAYEARGEFGVLNFPEIGIDDNAQDTDSGGIRTTTE